MPSVSRRSCLLHGWLDEGAKDAGLEGYADLFAEQGYVVLVPLMRGWGGGQNDCGLSQSADTARAIEWLASQPGVDPDRIGVVGFSFGGQVALLTGALSHRVKAIVSYSGPTDLTEAEGLGQELRTGPEKTFASHRGEPDKSAGAVDSRDVDTTVPPEQAQEMEQAIWKSGDSVQLHLVSGCGTTIQLHSARGQLRSDFWRQTSANRVASRLCMRRVRRRSRLRELWKLNEERPPGHLIAGVPGDHTANPSGRRAAAGVRTAGGRPVLG